jgi:hypothetical protein
MSEDIVTPDDGDNRRGLNTQSYGAKL